MFHVKHAGYAILPVMARSVAVTNQKGGVGKTTTAINLGAALASADIRVLLVDLDPQGNSSSGVGIERDRLEVSIYDALQGHCSARDAICSTEFGTLDVLPANRELVGATIELLKLPDKERCLRGVLGQVSEDYQYFLVDCPPSLGILTVNALVAADSLLIPIQCEYFALEGLSELFQTIKRIRKHLNPGLEIEGVLLTMYDERLNLASQIRKDVESHLGRYLFKTIIPRNVSLAECPSFGQPIMRYNARSRGASSYLALAREVLERSKQYATTLR